MVYVSKRVLKEVYFKTIIPSVVYCIFVWGNCSIPLFQRTEAIHTRAVRLVHKLPRETEKEDRNEAV